MPDKPLTVEVQRAGHEDPLTFDIEPEEDDDSGLRQMGIAPASTTVLLSQSDADLFIAEALTRAGADSENANYPFRLAHRFGEWHTGINLESVR